MPVRVKPSRDGRTRRCSAVLLSVLLCVIGFAAPGLTQAASVADRVDSAVRESAGPTRLTRDTDGLDRVASWIARQAFSGRQDPAALRDRLWSEGVRDFDFRPLTVVARGIDPVAALERALEDPKIRWNRYTHFALSVIEGGERTAVAVLLTRRGARFGDGLEQGMLALELLAGLDRPELFVTRPDGNVERFVAAPVKRAWLVDWDPGGRPGELLLEVVAHGETGPEVVALWRELVVPREAAAVHGADGPEANDPFPDSGPLAWDPYRGLPPATTADGGWIVGASEGPDRAPSAVDAKMAEDHLWLLIQNAREARGLARLNRSVPMTKAARQHAGELARGEPFGHHTSSGNALDRLTARGVPASRATENIAAVAHVAEAHAALMASPAHRANLLDAGVDHGGVGVVLQRDAQGRWSAWVSEVFAKPLPAGGSSQWADLALDAINGTRAGQSLDPVRRRARLEEIAQAAADRVVASGVIDLPRDDRQALVDQVRFHFNAVGRISVDLIVTAEPARAGRLAHALEDVFDEIGIGVATLTDPMGGHAPGTPLIVLLFVQR